MITGKQLADVITWARTSLAPIFVWLGFAHGPDALPAVAVLMVVNLAADSIDGPLARRSSDKHRSWIGDNDLAIDMFVSAGVLAYLTIAGFIPLLATGLYALLWILLFSWRGGPYVFGILFQAPIYAAFLFVLFRDATPWILVFAGWVLVALILSWPKFPKVMLPAFVDGLRDMINRTRHPRDIA